MHPADNQRRIQVYPRTKPGETVRRRALFLSKDDVMALFHLRQGEAANHLGISLTALKNACKRLDIKKWPYVRQKEGRGQASPQNSQDSRAENNRALDERSSESCCSGNESCDDAESEDSMAAESLESDSSTTASVADSTVTVSSTVELDVEEAKTQEVSRDSTASSHSDVTEFERSEATATQRRNSLTGPGPRDAFMKSMQVTPFSSSFIEWYVTAEEEELHRSIETSLTHRPKENVA
uniref:RWP-RK domain-containing protein n=1 Tax=Hanusia phi TaxID=3032 RepID=A0A7S0EYR6_9CRYP|mmetsp:Transcript_34506/g.77806  ORF Transcript_34506/g.77806 Transcript_34506/m.77806 type:complete len:239 (+) Transcript_34506:80-796(+)|eukprot:755642-Hanusia_phi.AAC.2